MVLQEIKIEPKDAHHQHRPEKLEEKECTMVPTYERHWATIFINELKGIKSLNLVRLDETLAFFILMWVGSDFLCPFSCSDPARRFLPILL